MNKLPTEILNEIFILLPIIQKQECMLTCRKWADVIQAHSLLDTISISYDAASFEKLIDLVKQQPALGQQVKTLNVLWSIKQTYDTRELHFLFPNLKTIRIKNNTTTSVSGSQSVHQNQFELMPVKSHLEHIEIWYPCEFTQTLLTSGLCSHLVSIDLKLNRSKASRVIFSLLKGIPNLKILNISNISISTDECEMIHKNLPLLTSLKIWTGRLLENTTSLNVSPAYTITAFKIGLDHGEPSEKAQIDWLQYISKKYPNLEHLEFFMGIDNHFTGETENLYQQGYSHVLNNGNSKLKSLAIGFADENATLLKLLDESKCQVNTLKFSALNVETVSFFTQFKQSKYIETLTLCDIRPRLLIWLKQVESLKTLKLSYVVHLDIDPFENIEEFEPYYDDPFYPITLNINNLLELCNESIESLEINPHFIQFDLNLNRQFPIKELDVETSLIPPAFDVFIRLSFPYLHTLSLGGEVANGTTLNFSNHHFSKLELNFNRFDFEVITLKKNKALYYSTDESKRPNDYSLLATEIAPVVEKDINFNHFATVVCASVKDLYLNRKHAYFL